MQIFFFRKYHMIQPPKTSKEPKRRGRGRNWRNSPRKKTNIGWYFVL